MDKIFDKEYVAKLKKAEDYDALFNYCLKFSNSNDSEAIFELAKCYYCGYGTTVDYYNHFYYTYKAALNGLPSAQNSLAYSYQKGHGVEQSDNKAIEWYTKAAEQGYVKSQYSLAICYYEGEGVEQSYVKAAEWFTKAAEQGDACSQNYLAYCYVNGYGVEQSYNKAFDWFVKAAEQDYAKAQYNLAQFYKNGQVVVQNDSKAFEWFTRAAEQGDVDAQYNLALCYENGYGVEQDNSKAVEWYTKAVEQGDVHARYNLSMCYILGQGVERNYFEAFELLDGAAEQGYVAAQFLLAFMYKNGDIIEENSGFAIKWYTRAAEQGHPEAQFNLAECYLEGYGVDQSDSEAAKWYTKAAEGYTKAAEQGYAEAQFNLAGCYLNGNGVNQNYSKAVEWLKKSAEQDYAKAQYNLALCYEKGYGVEQSNIKAAEWYTKAAEHGIKDAKQALKRINRFKWMKEKTFLRSNNKRQEVSLGEKEMSISQLMTEITELKQTNIELKHIIRSDIQKVIQTQTNIMSGVNSIDKKIDFLIDFVEKSLPDELEKQRKNLSMELLKINSSIEQNEETVAEWNRKMDEYICSNIQKYGETNEIIDAEYELRRIFDKAWYRLDEEVRTSLVSSRVMWLKCKEFSGSFDYSGVCITATAALESLLTKVFLKNFQDYLNNKNIPFRNWPSTLVYNDHGTLTPNKYFTLGNLKYLLGDSDEWSDETKWTKNRKMSLDNYLNSIIKKDENYNDPRDVFIKKEYNGKSFLERCEDIRKKYRNEAAHTNCVDKQTAEQCYDEIIGVREHLENINNIILILFNILKSN